MRNWIVGRCSIILVAAGLLYGCGPASLPDALTPSAAPSPTPHPRPAVVVVALDGARAGAVDEWLSAGAMPHLARLAGRGVRAEHAETVNPALTVPAYAALGTGAYPDRAGPVAGRFRRPHAALDRRVDGAAPLVLAVEPVWRTAMRHGLRAATAFWPGADPDQPDQRADYTVATGDGGVPSALHTLAFTPASGWLDEPPSFAPPQESSFPIVGQNGGRRAVVHVLAVDTSDDGTAGYDTFYLSTDKSIDERNGRLVEGRWAALEISENLHSGAYFRIAASSVASPTAPLELTVFQSRISYTRAWPAELLQRLDRQFGFPPPPPDEDALRQGWLSPADYVDMAGRRAQWMMDVALYLRRTYQPDLLLTRQTSIEEVGRRFLLVDGEQPGYSAQRAEEYAAYRERAAGITDDNLGRLWSAVDGDDAVLMVVSDHGLAPVHTRVNVNALLAQAGLLALNPDDGAVVLGESKAIAVASGATANVYINLQGRDRPGIVPRDEYTATQQAIVDLLSRTSDPDGQPVFARIRRRHDLSDLRLDSPLSGDVLAQAEVGYALADELGLEEVFSPTLVLGQAGHDATWPQMYAVFVAAGPGVRRGVTIGPMRVVDVAPTVARLLGVPPAETVEGRVLEEILETE